MWAVFVYCLVFGYEVIDIFDDGSEALRALESNFDDAFLIAVPKGEI